MKPIFAILVTVLAALCQVTVAPLFPVWGITFDFVLLSLILIAAFGTPQRAMVCIPVAALAYGFLSNREPGLLVLAYLPLLPLGLYLEEARIPLNHYARSLLAFLATAAWTRTLLVVGAVVGGADATPGFVLLHVLLPGMVLDFALLSLFYVPLRLLGWSGQGMSLTRRGYYSSL